MPLFRWNSTMRIIRSDRIFRFSASTLSNPRSMKTLPLPRTHLSFPVIAGSLRRSSNEDFELLQVALGDAPLEVEHLDADNLLLGVEVQHDARLHLLGLDNLRVVQAKVRRIDLRVVADSHIPQAAFLTTSRTFRPARLAMFTSASRLNWPIFPLSRAFKRGCVKPRVFAASAWVMPLLR